MMTTSKGKGGGPPRRKLKVTANKSRPATSPMPKGFVLSRMLGILWHAVTGTARPPVLKMFWKTVPLRQAEAVLKKIKRVIGNLMQSLHMRGRRR
nr:core protein C [Powassan virus]